MNNTIKTKIAQVILVLALTLGGVFSAQAASLDQAVFGQSGEQLVAQSTTAKPANLICVTDNEFIFTDTHVDPFMNTKIDVVKYAFTYNKLYFIEVNFKKSSINDYSKLLQSMEAEYGVDKEKDTFNKKTGDAEVSCTWELKGKTMILSYMKNKDFGFDNLYLIIMASEPDVKVTGK